MFMHWEKKLDLLGPIEQAARCLDIWLKDEKRSLAKKQKRRAAALMARYFYYEDQVTDALMLSFLRHYSGRSAPDMEDPDAVRMEIKAVLDQSQIQSPALEGRKRVMAAFVIGVLIMAAGLGAWEIGHKKITTEQQAELKALVQQIVAHDRHATAAGIWAETKGALRVRRYQDISWWHYPRSRRLLESRLNAVQAE